MKTCPYCDAEFDFSVNRSIDCGGPTGPGTKPGMALICAGCYGITVIAGEGMTRRPTFAEERHLRSAVAEQMDTADG